MKRHVEIVAPKFLDALGRVGPIRMSAMTVSPFVISKEKMDPVTLRHETIHVYQQQECSLLFTVIFLALLPLVGKLAFLLAALSWVPFVGPFYILYGLFYLIGLFESHFDADAAYLSIPFEMESYDHESDESYLSRRSTFGWMVYT